MTDSDSRLEELRKEQERLEHKIKELHQTVADQDDLIAHQEEMQEAVDNKIDQIDDAIKDLQK